MKLSDYMASFAQCVRIGKGGQKTVYRVDNAEGTFALKIIPVSDDPRTLQEIRILREIDIPSVPKVIDAGVLEDNISGDQMLFLLEEYIDGESLRELLNKRGKLTAEKGYRLLETLLNTEILLENKSILHRDIKPDNVMFSNDGRIFLVDFGIAKILGDKSLTMTNAAIGPCTPAYAPHELAANLKTQQDVRTDLYQIGVTVYESLSGINPFSNGARSRQEIFERGETITPPNFQIEGDTKGFWLQYLLMLMAKNPSQRPPTAKAAKHYFDAIKSTINLGGGNA